MDGASEGDPLPFRPFQHANSYPLIRGSAGTVPIGIAVREGNYGDVNPKTGKPAGISELLHFATTICALITFSGVLRNLLTRIR